MLSHVNKGLQFSMHNSWSNLKNISSNLRTLLAQSKIILTDWAQEKMVQSDNYGYLNLAINYPEIWEEIELIKKLVKCFNTSRYNMWKHKSSILNQQTFKELTQNIVLDENKGIIEYIDFKHEPTLEITEHNTASKLEKNYTYSREEFKVIRIRAFLSEHIREILSLWETEPSIPINITEAADNVLDYIKIEYPKLE